MSYTFAGTSVLNGSLKVRFANSDARAKQLVKLGDTDVNIVPLPSVMDKVSAVSYLLDSGFAKTDTIRLALEAEVAPKAKPKSVTKTVKFRAKIATKSKTTVKSTEPTEEEVDRLYNAVYGNQ